MQVYRCHRAGVYLGDVVAEDEIETTIVGRHAWSWTGALDCATLATLGPTGGRISPLTRVTVQRTDIIERHDMQPAAVEALRGVKPWSR